MTLRLYLHPLSSYCHKVLIALYENGTPFAKEIVDFGNDASAAAFRKLWPVGKMPVLRDEARDRTVPESSIIIEHLDQHYPGQTGLIPADADLVWASPWRARHPTMSAFTMSIICRYGPTIPFHPARRG